MKNTLKRFRTRLFLLLGTVLFILFASLKFSKSNSQSITALSELAWFRGDPKLLDPFHYTFVTEYYLLENLSTGLVFETSEGVNQWVPRIAEKWEQVGERAWRFYIHKDARWSDGSPLTIDQVANHIDILRKGKSRHLTLVKTIQSVEPDYQKNSLTFHFSQPVSEGLLHELSLADATILHPANLNDDWSVTSGPYYVQSRTREVVHLQANEYFNPHVEIASVVMRSQNPPIGEYDVLSRPSAAFRKEIMELTANAPAVYMGYPMLICYFYFPPADARSRDIETRRAFRWLVHQAFANFNAPGVITKQRQFVATGYPGRLPEDPVDDVSVDIERLKGQALQIRLVEKVSGTFPELLLAEAKKHEIELVFNYTPDESKTFAAYRCFMANQRDPLSSFRFLYGEGGALYRFYPQVAPFFAEISSASDERRKQLLIDLHRFTLDQVYATPFFAEHAAILHSNRIDLSAINPFDMRVRFFEMKWKK